MRKRYPSSLAKSFALALALLTVLPLTAAADEAAQPAQHLQLEVSINNQPTHFISEFIDLGDGRFASKASELTELGIKVPDGTQPDDVIELDSFSGLSYVYDEQKQAMAIETGDGNRITKAYDARGELNQANVTPSDYGGVLNYTLFGSYGGDIAGKSIRSANFSGLNATLDSRLISPLGVLNQTAILGATLNDDSQALRLDTTYTYSDDENLVRYRAGDFISGGTNWSRPVRLGGIQAQRAFTMRPDLIKSPLPAVSGSAAVPSSVDVYINGVKSYSKEVAAGPFQIDNIPTISGPGVAQVVTRDASGRETVQEVSFYNTPQLLSPGLSDFSVETGFARSRYGIESMGYGDALVGSATFRTGISDWLTFESHAEAGDSLINGGAGFVAKAFDLGIVSAALSGSSSRNGTGTQGYASVETKAGPVSINGRVQHAFENYDDLASLTARDNPYASNTGLPGIAGGLFSYAPPRAIDSLTLSLPLDFDKSNVSASFVRYQSEDTGTTELVTASYSRPLFDKANLQATGFIDVNDTNNAGFYVGMSMALDGNVSVSGGVTGQHGNLGANATASKPVEQEAGSWGWRVTDVEAETPYRVATVGYRASAARIEAGVTQDGGGVRPTALVEGAVAMIGGDIYTAGRIDDSFAVVDVHAPGVKVERENLLVGTSNEDGKILVPNLNSYHKNKISIDPLDLPVNAEPATTYDYVTPGYKTGVYVDFDVKKASPSAIVILKTADGTFLPAGSEGHLDGSDEPFVVGYDGQAYIKDLKAANTIQVSAPNGTCTAQFTFAATAAVQPTIGPEICQ